MAWEVQIAKVIAIAIIATPIYGLFFLSRAAARRARPEYTSRGEFVMRNSLPMRLFGLLFGVSSPLFFPLLMIAHPPQKPSDLWGCTIGFVLMAIAGIVLVLETNFIRVTVSDQGITYQSPWVSTRDYTWEDVAYISSASAMCPFIFHGRDGRKFRIYAWMTGVPELIQLFKKHLGWQAYYNAQRGLDWQLPTARRREIHLNTIDDLAAEVERLVEAAAGGRVQSLGRWSTAQALWHVGRMIEFSFDGFSFRYFRGFKWLTLILRAIAWRWLIRMALRPGFINPPYASALEPGPAVTLDAGAELIRRQIARIQKGEQMTQACSIEGPYTHEQWIYTHLRHAELHFGFLEVGDDRR